MLAPVRAPILTLAGLEAFDPAPARGAMETRYCCPLPSCSDKMVARHHQSLSVNIETGRWQCFRCKATGLLREHWQPLTRQQRVGVARARAFRVAPSSSSPVPTPTADPPRWDWRADLARATAVESTRGDSYLASRGIPAALAAAAGVRYCERWAGRPAVLFPMYDRAGALVAVNGRYIDGRNDPKTRSAGQRSLAVFATPGGLEAAPLVIVEGPFDALALASCGLPAVALVATRGPLWLPSVAAFRHVLLALDADTAGDEGAAFLAEQLVSLGARVERLRPAGAKDVNDLLVQHGCESLRVAIAPYLRGGLP